ncbi:YeiH family protein [Actinomyces vulturis]|uniref:YeiH family protein n=1 Tax=Actinomyces vulturis TaxID=1857645 RepID=UPI000837426F|nr:putative sulfate exporter family transporter [Actinomyces vulturis]
MTSRSQTALAVVPGLALAAAVAIVATAINHYLPLLSGLLIAIILGLILANTHLIPERCMPGTKMAGKTVLRFGVVLLGLRLSIPDVIALGWGAVGVIALTVICVYMVTLVLGRLMKVPHTTTVLTATGTAICGAAAVAGMSAVVRPSAASSDVPDDDVEDAAATAIASVTLFGTLGILLFPTLAGLLHLSTMRSGVWIGASIHEVGQVVAAGGLAGPDILDVAVLTKLGRVVLLAPLVAIVGIIEGRRVKHEELAAIEAAEVSAALEGRPVDHMPSAQANVVKAPLVPAFVIGFLIMVGIRSVTGDAIPAGILKDVNLVATFLLTMAMYAMGAGVNLRKLASTGLKSLGLGAIAGIVAGVVSLLGALILV